MCICYRIDKTGVIKVADFGLAKNTYEKMYFRQDKGEPVKLPVKWMAVESIEDGVFSEKSDVVRMSNGEAVCMLVQYMIQHCCVWYCT